MLWFIISKTSILFMKILGIETSCDESAAAVVNDQRSILSHVIHSQTDHLAYGGVVPELSARSHLQKIDFVIESALKGAGLSLYDIDAIAATSGPGLIGGVVVGCVAAKTLSMITNKPFIAVNHLEAHALTARLVFEDLSFPYLMLLASGGHTMIVIAEGVGQYKVLGQTLDDAIGEAFDKVAKLLGLGYPGGPIIEKFAKEGDENRFKFPAPLQKSNDYNFSLSGLKSAVRREIEKLGSLDQQDIVDICASFQETVAKIVYAKLARAMDEFAGFTRSIVVAGGVAANQYLNKKITDLASSSGFIVYAPPIKLCTDNGAMIAWCGVERLKLGLVNDLNFVPRSRWSLEEL
jgi:N6-L-threonylcarbamoyladenine synthase